jgi:ElaB/YqjD/DUF883 family membrane-anchored ribosome-binding protein
MVDRLRSNFERVRVVLNARNLKPSHNVKEAAMSQPTADETTIHNGAGAGHDDDTSRKAGSNGDATSFVGLRESARATSDALREACRGASAAISELSEEAYQIGSQTGARISRQVEAQPMTSLLVAASIGLVAGVFLARR